MKKVLWIIAISCSFIYINCTDIDTEFDINSYYKKEYLKQQYDILKDLILNHKLGNIAELDQIRSILEKPNIWQFLIEKQKFFKTSLFRYQNWWDHLTPVENPEHSYSDIITRKNIVIEKNKSRLRKLFKLALLNQAKDIISLIYEKITPDELFTDTLKIDMHSRENKPIYFEETNEFEILTLIMHDLENPIDMAKYLLKFRLPNYHFSKKVIELCSKCYNYSNQKIKKYCEFIWQSQSKSLTIQPIDYHSPEELEMVNL